MNSLNEGVVVNLSTPSGLLGLGYSFMWRDLSPAADLDVERITHSHCSKRCVHVVASMRSIINECRPSIKSSIFSTITLGRLCFFSSHADSRDSRVIPTHGSYAQLRLVFSYLLL